MGKFILTKYNHMVASAFYQDRDLLQVNFNSEAEDSILGNIYIGRVMNIVKNINAAFVEISKGQMCYYSLDENQYHIKVNGRGYQPNLLEKTGLSCGELIMVQVMKEGIKTKAPVVTCNLNLTGKYVVLSYGKPSVGVSAKIQKEEERERLRNLASRYVTPEYGFIVRTNAEGVSEEILSQEMEALIKNYETIRTFGEHKTVHTALYQTPKDYLCDIRDLKQDEVEEIVTDDIDLYEEIKEFVSLYSHENLNKLRFYEDKLISLKNLYGFEEKLKDALKEHVWLKSGAYLVIQPTEALTVIDVNTGKAVNGKRKVEDTFYKVNLEAAEMIAKQIRLRNLSGIIIVDFIDMTKKENKDNLLREFKEFVRRDPVKTTVVDITALGLVELTRKKVRKPLHEQIKMR